MKPFLITSLCAAISVCAVPLLAAEVPSEQGELSSRESLGVVTNASDEPLEGSGKWHCSWRDRNGRYHSGEVRARIEEDEIDSDSLGIGSFDASSKNQLQAFASARDRCRRLSPFPLSCKFSRCVPDD